MNPLDTVEQHLTTLRLSYERLGSDRIGLGFTGRQRSWRLTITTYGPWLAYFVYDLQQIPDRRLAEVLRLTNILNATLIHWGSFWVRPTDQQLCFDLCLPAAESPTCDQVRIAVSAQAVVDHFHPAFMRVVWGGERAEDALAAPDNEPSTERPENGGGLDLAV